MAEGTPKDPTWFQKSVTDKLDEIHDDLKAHTVLDNQRYDKLSDRVGDVETSAAGQKGWMLGIAATITAAWQLVRYYMGSGE